MNVSMASLVSLDFPDQVTRALKSANVPPSNLILEFTETQVVQDRQVAMDILARLRLKHIGLSIDDFGTGHSSLLQLRDLPFTELKIDRSFVSHLDDDPAGVTMFRHIAELAKSLQLEVVAEGVETQSQADICADHGCQVLQGYWFHRPMSGDKLLDAMRQDTGSARH